jgi:hypothetical protein
MVEGSGLAVPDKEPTLTAFEDSKTCRPGRPSE